MTPESAERNQTERDRPTLSDDLPAEAVSAGVRAYLGLANHDERCFSTPEEVVAAILKAGLAVPVETFTNRSTSAGAKMAETPHTSKQERAEYSRLVVSDGKALGRYIIEKLWRNLKHFGEFASFE